MAEVVHVAVGVIQREDGAVLLGQRMPGKHLAGYWEFPGGKVEAGETVEAALARELQEELGLVVTKAEPLIQVRHSYPERTVLLDTWRVSGFENAPGSSSITGHTGSDLGKEGQALQWVAEADLEKWQLPPADKPIVNAIRLPNKLLITPPPTDSDFLSQLQSALDQGIRMVQLRGADLQTPDGIELAHQAKKRCHASGAQLLINARSEADLSHAASFDGAHLSSALLAELAPSKQRPISNDLWLSAATHSAEELDTAAKLDVDFALLSPVAPTTSHPEAKPLGWTAAQTLVAETNLPIYALGGMQPSDIEQAINAGFQGIAAISGLWPKPTV